MHLSDLAWSAPLAPIAGFQTVAIRPECPAVQTRLERRPIKSVEPRTKNERQGPLVGEPARLAGNWRTNDRQQSNAIRDRADKAGTLSRQRLPAEVLQKWCMTATARRARHAETEGAMHDDTTAATPR